MRTTTQLRRLVTRPEIAFLMEAHDALVVRGHRAEAIDVPGARFVDNPDFASTGEAFSLSLAEGDVRPGTLVAFGDIVLKRHIIQALQHDVAERSEEHTSELQSR